MRPMVYIENNLLPKENIFYRGYRHWIVFLHVSLWLCVALFIGLVFPGFTILEGVILLFAVVTGITAFIFYWFSEIAVTNMRVIVKTGWIARDSTETMIQNIASIHIDQPVLGRIFNYGTVTILDRSGLQTPYLFIRDPFEFRRAVQSQIEQRYPVPKETINVS